MIFRIDLWANLSVQLSKNLGGKNRWLQKFEVGNYFRKRIQILFLNKIGWMSINYVLFRIELWANISVQMSKNFGGKNQMAPDVWGRQLFSKRIQILFLNRIGWVSIGHVIFCIGFMSKSFLTKIAAKFLQLMLSC